MKFILGSKLLDNCFIIYSFLAGFLFLALYVFLIEYLQLAFLPTGLILVLIYLIFFDVNHYFSTYFRVFLDKAYYEVHKKWLILSGLFIIFTPLAAYYLASYEDVSYQGFLYLQFFKRFVLVLGFYHLVKQNWGFMAMYKRQANEKDTRINWNLLTLVSGSFIALVLFSMKNPIWFAATEPYLFSPNEDQQEFIAKFWGKLGYLNLFFAVFFCGVTYVVRSYQLKKLAKSLAVYCVLVGAMIFLILSYSANIVLGIILSGLVVLFIIALFVSIVQQLKEPVFNKRKWSVLVASLVLYFGVLLFPVSGDKFILIAAITLPHNIQYLAFVPIYSRQQYGMSKKDHGLAGIVINKGLALIFIGLVFAVFFEFGRSGSVYFLPSNWQVLKTVISIFFLSLVLHHYYLDAVIWKFSREKGNKVGC